MPNPQEFADKFAANQQANLIKAGKAVVKTTLGNTVVKLLQNGIEPTAANLRDYLLKQKQEDPQSNHMTDPVLELLDEIKHPQDKTAKP